MTIRDQESPEFAYGIRGYDRAQVDDYVARLRDYAAEIEDQAAETERRATAVEQTVTQLRRQLEVAKAQEDQLRAELADSNGDNLAPRLAQILQLARDEAEDIRLNAREEASQRVEAADRETRAMLEQARTDAEQIVNGALDDERAVRDRIADMTNTKRELLDDLTRLSSIVQLAIADHSTDDESVARPGAA
jgi:cell division septum initiation protein DivIVA